MPRIAVPEGAKKIFIDCKVFNKIEKFTAAIAQAKKDAKKSGATAELEALAKEFGSYVHSKWDDIKLVSGIKAEEKKVVGKVKGVIKTAKDDIEKVTRGRKPKASSPAEVE